MAALLQQGVSKDKILRNIRENGMQGEAFKRYHLIDMKDLSNISRAFGLGEVQRSENDQESVRAWIQEWQESENNPVLFYKLQGEQAPEDLDLLQEDFFIVIQTPFQKAMAQKFASKGVCIDSTHGTTGYDFLLTTVMVTDECGDGLPVAWCLSNHEDFTHMCLFFKLLRENCGQLSPNWLMSDTASQFYNAWVAIMGGTPIRLICIWHVDRAWKQELRAKVKNSEMAEDIYKMLRTVMQATTVPEFEALLCKLEECLPPISAEFSTYFEREWLKKKEMWAYCYRVGLGINTNMIVEAFHRVFKYNYLKGKYNKRVDNCLLNLLKFVRDKYFERLIKLTKGKCNYKTRVIQDRHNKSKGLRQDMVTKVDNCKWSVQSDDNQSVYIVTKEMEVCRDPTCDLKCLECNICIHQYMCSCPDSLIQSTICKHIHLIETVISTESMPAELSCEMEPTDTLDDKRSKYVDLELHVLAEHASKTDSLSDIATHRENVKGKLLALLSQVQCCQHKQPLQQLEKQLNAAQSLFTSLQNRKPLKEIQPKSRAPANKNIQPQLRFYSTKKKRKRDSNVRYSKPTREEGELIFKKIQSGPRCLGNGNY